MAAGADFYRRTFYDDAGALSGIQEDGMVGTVCAGNPPKSIANCRRTAFVNCFHIQTDSAAAAKLFDAGPK